jgi:hypothetical protein
MTRLLQLQEPRVKVHLHVDIASPVGLARDSLEVTLQKVLSEKRRTS